MNILVVAAHSDDEVLGIGGTIARYRREGHSVAVQFLTDGVGSRGEDQPAAERRRAAASAAARILGYRMLPPAAFPDNALDTVALLALVKVIERAKAEVTPDLVLTHYWNDLNIDHRRAFEAVITAFRPQPGERCRSILCFEVASATEWGSPSAAFRPNKYIELSAEDVATAIEAYKVYTEEIRPSPHTRSVEAFRARRLVRGHEFGLPWAEGLMVCREAERLPAT